MSLFGNILKGIGSIVGLGRRPKTRVIFQPAMAARLPIPQIGRALRRAPIPIPLPFGGGGRAPRRRRRRKRFTTREVQDLMMAKMLFGSRSPLITILGIKMLGRGD